MNILIWFLQRLKEPSSWGGLSVILAMLGINIPAGGADVIVQLIAAVAAAIAVFVPEKGKPKPQAEKSTIADGEGAWGA